MKVDGKEKEECEKRKKEGNKRKYKQCIMGGDKIEGKKRGVNRSRVRR